jgi:hypothetical protein
MILIIWAYVKKTCRSTSKKSGLRIINVYKTKIGL